MGGTMLLHKTMINICICFLSVASILHAETASDSGLVAFYPFNGNANDESGNENNGVVNGAVPTSDRFGNPNSAFYLDGNDNIVVPHDSTLIPLTQWSFTLWIKPQTLTNNWSPIIYKGGPTVFETRNRVYSLWISNGMSFHFTSAGDGSDEHFVDSSPTTPEDWVFVACVVDRVNHQMLIYKNGVLDADVFDSYSTFNENVHSLMFGGSEETHTTQSPFKGSIDDIGFYNYGLTAAEVAAIYDGDEVAIWGFDETTGTVVADSTPFGNNGTAIGTTIVPGISGNARNFNGSGDHVLIPHPANGSLDMNSDQSFTVDAWFKTTEGILTNEIIRKGLAPAPGFALRVIGGKVEGVIGNNEIGSPPDTIVRITSPGFYNDGNWHHARFVRDRSVAKLYLYVDGDLVAGPMDDPVLFGLSNNEPLMIGRWNSPVYPSYFHGVLDEIRIAKRAIHTDPFQLTTWEIPITAFDGCGDTLRPIFGQGILATDCIDSSYGETELPPAPPAGAFDVRFLLPCGLSSSLSDFRGDSLIVQRWKLKLQPCSQPITLQWDTTGFPSGGMHIRDPFNGILVNVNMRTQTELNVPPSLTELWIERGSDEACRTVTIHPGWNMLSLPVNVPLDHYLSIFPSAGSSPFRFIPSGYIVEDTMTTGIGYWVKFNEDSSYNVCGHTEINKQVSVMLGWNMVGAFEDTILASQVTSSPSGIVITGFYHYLPPYQLVDTLSPGKAYWVKVNQSGTLYFSASSPYPAAMSGDGFLDGLPPVPPADMTPTESSQFRLREK